MKKIIFIFLGCCMAVITNAQMAGNRVYENMDDYRNRREYTQAGVFKTQPSLLFNEKDSLMYINAAILLNIKADFYVVTLGVNQSAKTSQQAMNGLNERIKKCTTEVKEILNLKKEDIYVDFISQTKIFDYDVKKINRDISATQKEMGFQTKKNIIIKFKNVEDMDMIIEKAAAESIYDIIKVDYIVEDVAKLHKKMLAEASLIINDKKDAYVKNSNFEVLPFYTVTSDNFYGLYPAKMYHTYKAFETSEVQNVNYYNSETTYTKKDLLMDKTFFYDGDDVSKYDKVMNPGMPQVGVQFVLQYSMKYLIKRKD